MEMMDGKVQFSAEDINENKTMAILAYILFFVPHFRINRHNLFNL